MKNKKLFAILTLVCFMFTLMPVAAFAAVDAANYEVKVYDGANYVEDVYVAPNTEVSVAALDGAADTDAAFYAVNEEGKAVQIKYTTAGTAAKFTFKDPGTYTIYGVVANNADLATLVGKTEQLVDGVSVADAVKTIENNLKADKIKVAATVVVEAPDAQYTVTAAAAAGSIVANGGFTPAGVKEVTVTLKNNGEAIVGKVPTISAPDYLTVVPADAKKAVTNTKGEIKYNITAKKAGNFKVVFGYEDARKATVNVVVSQGDIANVEVVKESTSLINKAYKAAGTNTGATVKFTDANGSVVDVTPAGGANVTFNATTGLDANNAIKVSVASQPANSRLTANNFELKDSQTAGASDLIVKTTGADLKAGSYKVQFALANGKSATVAFEVAKKGDTVGIRFVDPATTVALNASAPTFTVEAYDANGVTETLVLGTDYVLNAQGKALVTKDATTFKVSNEDKYIGSTITVLAKTAGDEFVATTTLEVVDNGMEVVYVDTTAEVGVTTVLNAKVVDEKGNKVDVPAAGANMKIVVLEKPANAYVYADAAMGATSKDIAVTFLGSVAGEYKIQTIIVDGNNEYVTGIETITVGANVNSFKDVVVMSIGANKIVVNSDVKVIDAAPIVENNRTFVPFRALAEAFGAEVAYDEATQSVTAELNGTVVVMTIGSAEYTVNGEVATADVAPFINGSRTMVPVRFVAEAFGINVTPVYGENGATVDVLFAK